MMLGTDVDVVLATYNGARFLPDFLASVERQVGVRWRLVARDDGSSDNTLPILDAFAKRHPGRVRVLQRQRDEMRGAVANFSAVAALSDAPYLCFADQDDVWRDDKLACMLAEIRRIEEANPAATPILLHSDLEVVDAGLQTVSPSFVAYQGLDPLHGSALPRLLVRNVVTGCATMANAALRDLALPVPVTAVMHDWWLALVAASAGRLHYMDCPLVKYRQHGGNAVGAQRSGLSFIASRLVRIEANRNKLHAKVVQASALLERTRSAMSKADARIVERFAELQRLGPLGRRLRILSDGFQDTGLLRNLGLLLLI